MKNKIAGPCQRTEKKIVEGDGDTKLYLEQHPRIWKRYLGKWRLKEELKLSRQHHWKKSARVLREEYWRAEKTCCHSDCSEKPPVRAGVKKNWKE